MAEFAASIPQLGIETPTQVSSDLARLQEEQATAAYDQQALPTRIGILKSQLQAYDLSNTKSALDLQVQRARTQNEIRGQQQAMIANEFSTFDQDAPDAAERWDEMVDKLVEDGAPQAAQFKGRYTPQMAKRWALAYAANSPSAALSDLEGGGSGAATGGQAGVNGEFAGVSNGAVATDYDKLFAGATPQQIAQARANATAHMAAVRRVEQSANPLQQMQAEAKALGYTDLQIASIQPSDVPNLLAKVKTTYGPLENYLTAREGRTAAGIPQPKIPAELKDVGGNLVSVDVSNPSAPSAKVIAEGAGKYTPYTDAQGNTWSFNGKTGQFEMDKNGPKGLMRPTGAGRGSVYEQKRTAWLDAHPGDTQGALDYAGGRSNKVLSAGEIEKTALSQATRDWTAVSLYGAPTDPNTGKPVDPQTWINNRARELAGQLTAANTPTPPGGGGNPGANGGQPPPQALAKLKEGVQTTFRNGQVWTLKNGKPVRVK